MSRARIAGGAWSRRGKVVVLLAVLMPVMVGTMSLAVDTAVSATARAQLQTAADSAALAAAQRMITLPRLQMGQVTTYDVAAAHADGIRLAGLNRSLNRPVTLLPNTANANTGTEDIVVGYLARPYDSTATLQTAPTAVPYYNAAFVRATKSADRGGRVPAFFSAILGNRGRDMTATAAAAALGVSGFRDTGTGANANLFPITLDKATFAAMIRGQTTDVYRFDAATGQVVKGSDGVTESRLFPVGNGYPGNWGTIKIGVSNNSTATLGAQIRYGVTPAQMATYPGGVIQPDPATGMIQFEGNPGISAGLKDDLASVIGKVVRIPIFDPDYSGGNGNNLVYSIVAFAPVRILSVNFQGKDKFVIIQPADPPEDATVVWGGLRNGPLPNQFKLVLIR